MKLVQQRTSCPLACPAQCPGQINGHSAKRASIDTCVIDTDTVSVRSGGTDRVREIRIHLHQSDGNWKNATAAAAAAHTNSICAR